MATSASRGGIADRGAICARCSVRVQSSAAFCPNCGARFAYRCDRCGAVVPVRDRFCEACGRESMGPGAGIPAVEAAEWVALFRSLGWRELAIIDLFRQAASSGILYGVPTPVSDYLIAVPVNGRPGNPSRVVVNGVVRIDTRRREPSQSRARDMLARGPAAIRTDFGALLVTRKSIVLWTPDPSTIELWSMSDIREYEAQRQLLRFSDRLDNHIEIVVSSALSKGRAVLALADWMFGDDIVTRLTWKAQIDQRLHHDGELATALHLLIAAASIAT